MKARDLVIVALLLALGGIAVADTLRGDGPSGTATEPVETAAETVSREVPARLPPAPAPGRLLFLDDDGCRLHEFQVSTGNALQLPGLETGCEVWAAPRGEKIAYSLPGPTREGRTFRFMDLNHPLRRLGTGLTVFEVLWTQDGLRSAWCPRPGAGAVLDLGEAETGRLPACPVAFTPDEQPAFVTLDGLRAGGKLVARTTGFLTSAAWGADESLALVYQNRIDRLVDGEVTNRAALPSELRGRTPILSPDNCAALYPVGGAEIRSVDICVGIPLGTFQGTDAAWSPDGEWIAVLDEREIFLVQVVGGIGSAHWPVRARDVAWLG